MPVERVLESLSDAVLKARRYQSQISWIEGRCAAIAGLFTARKIFHNGPIINTCDFVHLLKFDTVGFYAVLSNELYDFLGKGGVHRSQFESFGVLGKPRAGCGRIHGLDIE